MRTPRLAPLAAATLVALLTVAAPAASADTLVIAAPGARNLASAGGWLAWAAPAQNGRWMLTLRSPDGTVTTPPIADFAVPPDPSIGSDRFAIDGRRLLVVYSRCAGASAIAGCDVYALDVATGHEATIPALATARYSETAPSIVSGRLAFVRRGARTGGTGVHAYTLGSDRPPVRVSPRLARETATNAGRVAYAFNSRHGGGLAIRRHSGRGAPLIAVARAQAVPRSPVLTRYRAAWLREGGILQASERFAGSGGPFRFEVFTSARRLPSTTQAIALGEQGLRSHCNVPAAGAHRADPPAF